MQSRRFALCFSILFLIERTNGRAWNGNNDYYNNNNTFAWNNIPAMATCQPTTLSWMFVNESQANDSEMTISITNSSVDASSSSTISSHSFRTAGSQDLVCGPLVNGSQQITPGAIHSSQRTFVWPSVNVSAGWYVLLANFSKPNTVRESSAFFIANGSDLSCLFLSTPHSAFVSSSRIIHKSTTSGTTTALSSTLTTQKSTTSSGPTTGLSSTSASASATAFAATISPATASRFHVGVVVGSVVGGLAAIAWGIAACFLARSLRRRRDRNWAILNSRDTKDKAYPSSETAPSTIPLFRPEYPADALRPFDSVVRRNSAASAASYTTYSGSSRLQSPSLGRYDSSFATAPSPAYPSGASQELADDVLSALASVQVYNAVDPSLGSQPSLSPLVPQAQAI
ncbi:hypothetical protein C8F01DRAFT_378490 [Mycena amicta]|nr:hypothetical protein C8F01DRAFT_378490 [Mycena amicta]